MCNCMNINMNPVRDYRSVENRRLPASHAVRHATRIFQYGCIPYGMQVTYGIQFSTGRYILTECLSTGRYIPMECLSTGRYIPMKCSTKYNTILNLNQLNYKLHKKQCK